MKTALVVIDMQNDYLYAERKKQFTYNTDELVSEVNGLIHQYRENGSDIIYIRHIIQNLPTNRLLFGYSIAGTEGAEIFDGIDIVSDYCFDKLLGDALSNKKLLELVRQKEYDELHLCGLDEYGCVAATALGAYRRGIKAVIVRKGTATILPQSKADKVRRKIGKAEIQYI